ncbi:unnamed protein product [Ranitomeya imitator]|uniref:Uncharacterized protein n=1 Tax=Ranitomeya imitator TaxID=111125 RepID=A0ABN9M6T2_9NEOB|nr:unnamed protein product [Ranitomeya imitator]
MTSPLVTEAALSAAHSSVVLSLDGRILAPSRLKTVHPPEMDYVVGQNDGQETRDSVELGIRSVCEVQWEAEFFSLQDNNNKLVAALREANANVEKWKKQLAGYQEEAERLRQRHQ